jgi:hypothetical protein
VFTRLVANASDIRSRMAEQAAIYQADLTAQFDRLFATEAV